MKIVIRITGNLAIFFLILLAPTRAHATVGGPTYIEQISYNEQERSVYFLNKSQTGRGCAPEIGKINLATNNQTFVMSCDAIEKKYGTDIAAYNELVEQTFLKNTPLTIIDLEKNKISARVTYTGEEKIAEENISARFHAVILQGGEEKGAIDFRGCYKDQPAVMTGYLIPGSSKIAIVISRIGDCFEGGYVKDDIYLVDGISVTDRAAIEHRNSFSGPRVYQGDLVVSVSSPASDTEYSDMKILPYKPEPNKKIYIILAVVGAILVSIGVGLKLRS